MERKDTTKTTKFFGLLANMTIVLIASTFCAQAQTLQLKKLSADVISFSGDAGTDYRLETATDIASTNWETVVVLHSGHMYGNSSPVRYTNITEVMPQRFYRTVNLGPTAPVDVNLNTAISPPSRVVKISDSEKTANVVMLVADFTSVVDATGRSIECFVTTSTTNLVGFILDVKAKSGGAIYSADSIAMVSSNRAKVKFTNLLIPLQANSHTSVTFLIDVAKNTGGQFDGVTASIEIVSGGAPGGPFNNPYVEDASYFTLGVTSNTVTGATATFTSGDAVVSNTFATLGAPVVDGSGNTHYPCTFGYTLMAGDNSLYISKNATTAMSLAVQVNTILDAPVFSATPDSIAGDTVDYYVVPAGSSRSFTAGSVLSYVGHGNGSAQFLGVSFGTTPGNLTTQAIAVTGAQVVGSF